MPPPPTPRPLDPERRRRIIETARRRLEHYGYEKTTMAEIAAEAGMAVGTLYLYFRNKEDLLEAFGEQCQGRYMQALQRIANSDLPPTERLRELARRRVLAMKEQIEATPHGGDILLRMMQRGHTFCRDREERERKMVEQILREGTALGEFSVADPAQAARVFRSAFSGFMPPASLGRSNEEVAREVEALYALLLGGLRAAPAAPRDQAPEVGRRAAAATGPRSAEPARSAGGRSEP